MSDKNTAAEQVVLSAEEAAYEAAQARVRELERQLSDAKAERKEAKGSVAKRTTQPRACACGCEGMTAGGIFLPGHDARLKSRLLTLIDEGGAEGLAAREELAKYPRLATHDWPSRLGRKARDRSEKAERKERDAREKAERIERDTREREQAQALTRRSREEQIAIAREEEERKRAAIKAAKAAAPITVPAS